MSKRSCAAAESVADAFLRMARVNCFTTDRHAYHKNRAAAQSVADAFCEWLFREGDLYDRFSDS